MVSLMASDDHDIHGVYDGLTDVISEVSMMAAMIVMSIVVHDGLDVCDIHGVHDGFGDSDFHGAHDGPDDCDIHGVDDSLDDLC